MKLIESSTNPRKAFDEERLEELAESIRSKGILSPLVVRPVNGHFEIVAGARRYRAAQRAGLKEIPVRVGAFTDAEALEIQIIENIQRADVHPFEEAQGFRALLDREGAEYTIEKIAAKTGKAASFIAKRLKLLDLTQPAADALLAGHIGVEHALLIAKLAPEIQEKALAHCFDGYFAATTRNGASYPRADCRRGLSKTYTSASSRCRFRRTMKRFCRKPGVARTVRSVLDSIRSSSLKFVKTLAPMPNVSIASWTVTSFSAWRSMPNLVMISEKYNITGETPILPRRNYVEVITRKAKQGKDARPEQRVCNHLTPAIYADGLDKGRLVKVCADRTCKVHFHEQQKEEKQRLQWKAEKTATNRKLKQTISFRHRLMADVLKRVKPQFGTEEMRMVAGFALRSLSHELACRLAKRHGLQNPKDPRDYQMAEKARTLYKKADAAGLARLIFEAILVGCVERTSENKDDDPLTTAAALYEIDTKALRAVVSKEAKEKVRKKAEKSAGKLKSEPTARRARK